MNIQVYPKIINGFIPKAVKNAYTTVCIMESSK